MPGHKKGLRFLNGIIPQMQDGLLPFPFVTKDAPTP
jgi:hypothetical protein